MFAEVDNENMNELVWMAGFTRFYRLSNKGYGCLLTWEILTYNTNMFFVVSWIFHYVMQTNGYFYYYNTVYRIKI